MSYFDSIVDSNNDNTTTFPPLSFSSNSFTLNNISNSFTSTANNNNKYSNNNSYFKHEPNYLIDDNDTSMPMHNSNTNNIIINNNIIDPVFIPSMNNNLINNENPQSPLSCSDMPILENDDIDSVTESTKSSINSGSNSSNSASSANNTNITNTTVNSNIWFSGYVFDPKKTKENARKRKQKIQQALQDKISNGTLNVQPKTNNINIASTNSDSSSGNSSPLATPIQTEKSKIQIKNEANDNNNNNNDNDNEACSDNDDVFELDNMPFGNESTTTCNPSEYKRLQRLQRNRASAQLSRERKKAYMKDLESAINSIQHENHQLLHKLQQLERENQKLRLQLGYSKKESIKTESSSKKRKTSSNHNNNNYTSSTSYSNTHNTNHSRTSLVMFGLVFSFALFYHFAGLEFITNTNSNSNVELLTNSNNNNIPALLSPVSSPVHSGRVLLEFDNDSTTSKQLVANDNDPNNKALIHVNSNDNKGDLYALDVYNNKPSSPSNVPTVNSEFQSFHNNWQLFDPNYIYIYNTNKKADNNNTTGTSTGNPKHFMFCPSAIHIKPQFANDEKIQTNSTNIIKVKQEPVEDSSSDNTSINTNRNSAKRLRKVLGLPAPEHNKKAKIDNEDDEAKLQLGVDDNLLLWVPLSSLDNTENQTDNNNNNNNNDNEPRKQSGLVEISCQISNIRPVWRV